MKSGSLADNKTLVKLTQTLGPVVALCFVAMLFAVLDKIYGSGQFSSFRNFSTVTVQSCTIAVAALGMTIIIIAGGIDLSCGTAIALSATVLAWGLREDVGCMLMWGDNFTSLSKKLETAEAKDVANPQLATEKIRERLVRMLESKKSSHPDNSVEKKIALLQDSMFQLKVNPTWLEGVPNDRSSAYIAAFLGLATGLTCGFVNGTLISSLRVVPFIVTLGTMTVYLGCGNWLSGSTPIRPSVKQQVPEWLASTVRNLPEDQILGFPSGVWIAVVVSILLAIGLRYTVFGRYVSNFGIAMCPTVNGEEAAPHLTSIEMVWNTLIGEGLLQYGRQTEAAELVTRLMGAVINQLKSGSGFAQSYDAHTGQPGGERNSLFGLAPVGLFLQTAGLERFSPTEVIVRGNNPFPWPITVQYRGVTVVREGEETRVTFPTGKPVVLNGPGPYRLSLT